MFFVLGVLLSKQVTLTEFSRQPRKTRIGYNLQMSTSKCGKMKEVGATDPRSESRLVTAARFARKLYLSITICASNSLSNVFA